MNRLKLSLLAIVAFTLCSFSGCSGDDDSYEPHTGTGVLIGDRYWSTSRTNDYIPAPDGDAKPGELQWMVFNSLDEVVDHFGDDADMVMSDLEEIDFSSGSLVLFMLTSRTPYEHMQVNFLEKFEKEVYCIDISYFGSTGKDWDTYNQFIAITTPRHKIARDARFIYHTHTY